MTELLTGVEAPSDAELISRVRGGDVAAYGDLFSRHVDAARRLGRQLVRGPDVDDLVSEGFAKTLHVLQAGGGPDVAFRAYLLTSIRRLHVDRIRATKKVHPTDDMTPYDAGTPFQDTAVANFENGAAARAFSSLPERWQLVLWHLEVEGQKPADIAPLLGMSANSVSALAYRAREGLRQAFLTMHLADCPTEQCRWVNEHLGAYVRKGLSRRDTTKVEEHLDTCRRCTAMYLELSEVNSNLAAIIGPLLLGAAAAGYISSSGAAGLTGVSALFGRVRDAVGGNAGGGGAGAAAGGGGTAATGGLVTAGGVIAASVAAVTAAAFVFGGGPEREVLAEADEPVGIVQTPPAGPADDMADDVTGGELDDRTAPGAADQDAVESEEVLPEPDVEPTGTSSDDSPDVPADRPGESIDDEPGDAAGEGPGPGAPKPDNPPLDLPVDPPLDLPDLPPDLELPPDLPDLPVPDEPKDSDPGSTPGTDPSEPGQPSDEDDTPGKSDGKPGGGNENFPPQNGSAGDDAATIAFDLEGTPLVTAADEATGENRHTYSVSMIFVGVEEGGFITLTIESPSNGQIDNFVSSETCSVLPEARTATCSVDVGSVSRTVDFQAWLPGRGRDVALVAAFNGTPLGRAIALGPF